MWEERQEMVVAGQGGLERGIFMGAWRVQFRSRPECKYVLLMLWVFIPLRSQSPSHGDSDSPLGREGDSVGCAAGVCVCVCVCV